MRIFIGVSGRTNSKRTVNVCCCVGSDHPTCDRFHLRTGVGCCTKFRDVFGSDLHGLWQEISDSQAAKTVDLFMDDVDSLIGCCLAPASHQDKLAHLCAATKPFQMTCEQLESHLRVISHISCCLTV